MMPDPYKDKSWKELRDVIADYESAISFDITCTECDKLFDKLCDAEVELEQLKRASTGHGYVYPRPDGTRERCGGPMLCSECARDFVEKIKSLTDEL